MKKLLSLVLIALLLLSSAGFASELKTYTVEELESMTVEELEGMTVEELISIIEQLNAELAKLRSENEEEESEPTPEPTAVPKYTELAKGSKGDNVKVLQQRLKDLGYLSGSVDGCYGGGTASAVSSFQNQNGLPATGTADVATQELLHSDKAEKAIVYEVLDYKGASRNPSDYFGKHVQFTGKILQVIEEDTLISFRIASKGNYDDVVFVSMSKPDNYSRLLEDDKVTVSGVYFDLMSYETVMGATVTIPWIYADLVALR